MSNTFKSHQADISRGDGILSSGGQARIGTAWNMLRERVFWISPTVGGDKDAV